ncbi:hypothetical protein J6590_034649 [Homalodisca vitripennis]|nr:hypothetical protein J6590_034649 [Homalodisca vitripennis]
MFRESFAYAHQEWDVTFLHFLTQILTSFGNNIALDHCRRPPQPDEVGALGREREPLTPRHHLSVSGPCASLVATDGSTPIPGPEPVNLNNHIVAPVSAGRPCPVSDVRGTTAKAGHRCHHISLLNPYTPKSVPGTL